MENRTAFSVSSAVLAAVLMFQAPSAIAQGEVKNQTEASNEQHADQSSGSATVARIISDLEKVRSEAAEGKTEQASQRVYTTYMSLFEGIEGALIEQDADLVEDLEKDFNVILPQLLEQDAPVSAVSSQIDAMKEKLARARKLLKKAEADQGDVF